FSLAVVCCLALVGAMFVSCNDEQKSSYQYEVKLAAVDQDEKLAGEFELKGLPIINEEMEKASDQKGSIIFKDTRKNADKRAKDAFANGVERVRKETNNSYEGLIVVLNVADPDTNKPIQVDKVTL
ncbi:MAG: hypothetical protein IKR52_04570, partial [Paludibacteraceae bacterium]|nr:hypothetical protein [Paludibacteraceae bacterium]